MVILVGKCLLSAMLLVDQVMTSIMQFRVQSEANRAHCLAGHGPS